MTLVIALKWLQEEGEGVLISSDSRATYGPIAYEVKKIHPIFYTHDKEEIDLAVAGGAGDPSIVKYGYSLAESVLKSRSEQLGFRCLSQDEFSETVREIETKLISRFSALRREGIEPEFQMILASVDSQGKASMYIFDYKGMAEPVHDDPGFAIIGKGAVTGGVLLTRLWGYSPERSSGMDLGMLSAFVIDVVSEIDPAVGSFLGESIFMRIKEGKVTMGPLQAEAWRKYKDSIGKRRELLQQLQMLCDQRDEDVVKKALDRLMATARRKPRAKKSLSSG